MRKATLLILLLNAGVAFGQVYSWRDANGGVHYSDQPPTGADAQKLDVPSAAGSGDAAAPKSWTDKEQDFRKRRAEAAAAEAKADKESKQAAEKKENCSRARANLQGLESGQIRYTTGANGERVALDGDVRDAELARARAIVDSWCN
jgi:hypothetical protein